MRTAIPSRMHCGLLGLCLPVAGALALAASAAAAVPAAPATPSTAVPDGFLESVSATAASNAWAVGFIGGSPQKTLILHWNGTAWARVTSPNPGPVGNVLTGVSAVSASDAWAVGASYLANGSTQNLVLHWNGTAWKRVAVPAGVGGVAVSADSASDVWAVQFARIVHWNGTSWAKVSFAHLSANLVAVSAQSPSDVWAAGTTPTARGQNDLTLHWNGTSWAQVPTPSPAPGSSQLFAVSALSSAHAWAVGGYGGKTLALRWNGSTWAQVAAPNPGGTLGSTLLGVTALSASNAWAVGAYNDSSNTSKTLVLHWNGTAWKQTASPTPPAGAQLSSVSAVSRSDAWAVGYVNPTSTARAATLILHWNGQSWTRS